MAEAAVVREITIRGRSDGVQQVTQDLGNLGTAQNKVIQITDQLRQSIDQATQALNSNVQNLNQLKSANDNVSSSYRDMVNGARDISGGLADTAEHTLNLINHLKLLALAAYAVSPGFRAIANAGIAEAFGRIPPVAGVAATAIGRVAAPALSFFSSIAIPIAGAVLAFEGFNAIVKTGSDLLDKYGDNQRKLFAPETAGQLEKLTKFQTDIDPTVVQRAEQLANELKEAKQNISDFLKVQIDLNDVALTFQGIWIHIVSLIGQAAKAAGSISPPEGSVPKLPGMIDVPGVGLMPSGEGLNAPDQAIKGDRLSGTFFDEFRRARTTLANAMGGGFQGRFAGDINALANQTKPEAPTQETLDAYDRFKDSISTTIQQLQLEADGASKTSQQVEELKIAHLGFVAASKAGIPVTDEMRAQWKAWADQIAALNIQIKQTQALQSEQFKSQTMFMSPADQAAASVAHQIDPTNWQAHMQDLAAQTARYNSEIGTARDMTVSFGESIGNAMLQGGNRIRSVLIPALNSLEKTLLDMMIRTGVNSLASLLSFAPSGGGTGNIGGTAGNLTPIHHAGGIVGFGTTMRYVHPAYFENASRFHEGGMIGSDEVPIIARRGEGVFTPEQMRAMGGGTQVNVVVQNNHPGAGVDVQQNKRDDGGVDLILAVKDIMNQHVASGGLDAPMRARYGAQIRARAR